MSKRALLLINPNSRKGQNSLAVAVQELNALDFELIVAPTKSFKDLPQLVKKHQERVEMVIVGGGDGTLNAAVDSLVEAKLPLGILPLGTANDLARTLNIPLQIKAACQAIAFGELKYIDLGWVNGKYFFNVASLGLSVKITESLSKGAKRQWGVLAYALSAIKVISKTRPFHATIRSHGEEFKVKTIQIAVGNGRYYGGGLAIAADAAIDDQRLDLYSLEVNSWWQMFPLLRTLRKGEQAIHPWVLTREGEEFEVLTRKTHAINTDGEITTQTPAIFRVIPHALQVYMPQKVSGENG